MTKFTEQQLEDYQAYEKVRQTGRYNMLMERTSARYAAGLSEQRYEFVSANFEDLRNAVEKP